MFVDLTPWFPFESCPRSRTAIAEQAELDELWACMQRLEIPVYSPPTRSVLENYGPIDVFIVEDPDGVMIEFVALPTREQIKAFRAGAQ